MQNEIDLACIKDELCKITAKQLNIEEDTVNENSAFLEDLGADSLDIVELLAEIEIKYAGYLARQRKEVERQRRLEDYRLPKDIDYKSIKGLRLEAIQKLSNVRPLTIGQASRISGVSPADISVLMIYLGIV